MFGVKEIKINKIKVTRPKWRLNSRSLKIRINYKIFIGRESKFKERDHAKKIIKWKY